MDLAERVACDGFAIVRDAVPLERCQRARTQTEREAESRPAAAEGPRARPPAGRRLRLDDAGAEGWSDLLAVMTEIAGAAAAAELRPVRVIRFDKAADANWFVPWHQDRTVAMDRRDEAAPGFGPWSTKAGVPHAEAPASLLARMLTVRLHLDDCPVENGPLLVVPGSHGLHRDGQRPEDVDARAVACTARAGDCVLMRPLLWHASRKATKPAHRRVLHVEFGPQSPGAGLQWADGPHDARVAARGTVRW